VCNVVLSLSADLVADLFEQQDIERGISAVPVPPLGRPKERNEAMMTALLREVVPEPAFNNNASLLMA